MGKKSFPREEFSEEEKEMKVKKVLFNKKSQNSAKLLNWLMACFYTEGDRR